MKNVYGNNRDENGAIENGDEPVRTPEKRGDIGGSKGGIDSDGYEKDVKRRDETENIRAVVEMKMEVKRPRGRPKLRWNDNVRMDLKAWNIKEEWATDRERWKGLCKTRYPTQGDGGDRGESLHREHCN